MKSTMLGLSRNFVRNYYYKVKGKYVKLSEEFDGTGAFKLPENLPNLLAAHEQHALDPHVYRKGCFPYLLFNQATWNKHRESIMNEGIKYKQAIEIGCASGEFTLSGLTPSLGCMDRYLATDINMESIRRFREMLENDHKRLRPYLTDDNPLSFKPNVEFRKFNMESIEDAETVSTIYGHFGLVISLNAIQWCRDLSGTMQNIRTLMGPGSQCLLTFSANGRPYSTVFAEMAKNARWSYAFEPMQHMFNKPSLENKEEVKRLCKDLDLEIKTLDIVPLTIPVETHKDQIKDFVLGICPARSQIWEMHRYVFDEQLMHIFYKHEQPDPRKPITFPYVVLHAKAR